MKATSDGVAEVVLNSGPALVVLVPSKSVVKLKDKLPIVQVVPMTSAIVPVGQAGA